jgi:hypothetical protein
MAGVERIGTRTRSKKNIAYGKKMSEKEGSWLE